MLAWVFVFASSAHLLYRIDDKAQVDACKGLCFCLLSTLALQN